MVLALVGCFLLGFVLPPFYYLVGKRGEGGSRCSVNYNFAEKTVSHALNIFVHRFNKEIKEGRTF